MIACRLTGLRMTTAEHLPLGCFAGPYHLTGHRKKIAHLRQSCLAVGQSRDCCCCCCCLHLGQILPLDCFAGPYHLTGRRKKIARFRQSCLAVGQSRHRAGACRKSPSAAAWTRCVAGRTRPFRRPSGAENSSRNHPFRVPFECYRTERSYQNLRPNPIRRSILTTRRSIPNIRPRIRPRNLRSAWARGSADSGRFAAAGGTLHSQGPRRWASLPPGIP